MFIGLPPPGPPIEIGEIGLRTGGLIGISPGRIGAGGTMGRGTGPLRAGGTIGKGLRRMGVGGLAMIVSIGSLSIIGILRLIRFFNNDIMVP
tara:strand:- start:466 stop:741 length:276 start_codon:yes stop_codon:yes gene_type:complete